MLSRSLMTMCVAQRHLSPFELRPAALVDRSSVPGRSGELGAPVPDASWTSTRVVTAVSWYHDIQGFITDLVALV